MRRCLSVILPFLICAVQQSSGQEPAYREDLRFVESLRARGDNDLALEFLQRLAKGAPPELAKELPLELAKTRLRVATDEPETGKRLALYKEASSDFQKFIAANPGHPRIPEANLDIARVLNLQGKTELNRALLAEDSKTSKELVASALGILREAAKRLAAAAKEQEALRDKLPDPDAEEDAKKKKEAQVARGRAENEIKQTQLEVALNLYDQSAAHIVNGDDKGASDLLYKAKDALAPLATGNEKLAVTWKAMAWLGRVAEETESTDKAHQLFQLVLKAGANPAAAEGVRLARYFRLLVIEKKPSPEDNKRPGGVNFYVITTGRQWRQDYRRFLKTPEGCGMTFLLAQVLLKEAARFEELDRSKKQQPRLTVGQYRAEAQRYLRELETSENEFTERARRMKLQTMVALGVFKKKIESLKTFEECFVRAQYESFQLSQEQKEAKDPKEAEAKRKERVKNILDVLQKGLAAPDVKKLKRGDLELNTARSMYAFWALNEGKLEETIKVGESFARQEPGSSQAEMAAVYALQAYSQVIGQKAGKFEEIAEDRARMFSLAAFMEGVWPKTVGGELARHSMALQLIRDKEPNYPEAIKKLSLVSPTYANYTLVCRLLADACMKAEKEGIEPIAGDRPGDYRKRALMALESMPETALGPDPFTNVMFVAGKAELGRELFRYKRFQQMDDLATNLLGKIDKLKFNDDNEKHQALLSQLRFELIDVKLFARYGLADLAFVAGNHAEVLKLVDPLVDAAAKGEDSPETANLKKNTQLGMALMVMALRSNIQQGKIGRTQVVLDVMDRITGEGGDTTNILRLLAGLIRGQIDDLRNKGDKEAVAKAVKGYTEILNKRVEKQTKKTPEFSQILAECYSSLEKHEEAAKVLEEGLIKDPKPGAEEERTSRQMQVKLVRELLRSKTPDNVKKASGLLEKMMAGPDGKAGWGARDLLALKELGKLREAEDRWNDAFSLWSNLVKRLVGPAAGGGPAKEHYLECYYHMVYSYYKYGLSKPSKDERDKYVQGAATQMLTLERSWDGTFGSDTSTKRFNELLEKEAPLRQEYEALKKK